MEAAVTAPPPPVAEIDEALLPPRPDLSRFMMTAGFMLIPTRFLDSCRRRCGDYFTLRPAADRLLVVTADPVAVEQVFKGDPNLLYAGEGNVPLAPILGPGSTLLLDGPEHLRHRRLLLPPFHGERMRRYGDVMREAAEREIARWPRGRGFAVLPSMQSITLEVIMRAVFGFDDPERRERIGAPLRRLLDTVASRPKVLALALTAGRYGPRSPWARFLAERERADALLYEAIAERRRDPGAADGDDVFSLLLAARDEEGEPLTDAELRDELMTLLVAGHETTATALAWTLERLTRTPDVLAKLVAEHAEGGEEYLDATIRETLRLRPVVPAVARRLQAPMRIGALGPPRRRHHRPLDLPVASPGRHLRRPARVPAGALHRGPPGDLRVDPLRRRRAPLPRRQLRHLRDEGGAAGGAGLGSLPRGRRSLRGRHPPRHHLRPDARRADHRSTPA